MKFGLGRQEAALFQMGCNYNTEVSKTALQFLALASHPHSFGEGTWVCFHMPRAPTPAVIMLGMREVKPL